MKQMLMFYAFCIEPLLNKIKTSLLFKGIPVPNGHEACIYIAAHADHSTEISHIIVNSGKLDLEYFALGYSSKS